MCLSASESASLTPPPGLHLRGLGRPLPLSQILCFEADDNYTRVHVRGQRWPLLYGYTLGVMCQRFPCMARVSKALAVHPGSIQRLTRRGLVLTDGRPIALSRYHLKRLPGELKRAEQVAGL